MKTHVLKLGFYCLFLILSNCKTDLEQLDIPNTTSNCHTIHIELDLQGRMHRSELTSYTWKNWNDGLNISWKNNGQTLIFSFTKNSICDSIAILGAESEDICTLLYSDLDQLNQSFTFHLEECLVTQSSIFLSISFY